MHALFAIAVALGFVGGPSAKTVAKPSRGVTKVKRLELSKTRAPTPKKELTIANAVKLDPDMLDNVIPKMIMVSAKHLFSSYISTLLEGRVSYEGVELDKTDFISIGLQDYWVRGHNVTVQCTGDYGKPVAVVFRGFVDGAYQDLVDATVSSTSKALSFTLPAVSDGTWFSIVLRPTPGSDLRIASCKLTRWK